MARRSGSIFDVAFPGRRRAPVSVAAPRGGDEFQVVMDRAWQLVRQGYDMHQALEIAWREYDSGRFGTTNYGIPAKRRFNFSPAARAKFGHVMRDAWALVRSRGMTMSQALRQAWKMNGGR